MAELYKSQRGWRPLLIGGVLFMMGSMDGPQRLAVEVLVAVHARLWRVVWPSRCVPLQE